MQIIGMTGQARCGKTHAAELMCRLAFDGGATPHQVSFAGALKEASAEAGYPKETHPNEYRKFCQEEGAARREEDPDYWVNITMEKIRKIREIEDAKLEEGNKFWEQIVIIDDVRYQNEIDAVLRMGGTMVHVTAGDRLPTPHARWRRHESEKLARALDRTDGKGQRFAKYFENVEMPWGGKPEADVYWLDNSAGPAEFEKLIKASFNLMIEKDLLYKESKKMLEINDLSDEERQELMDALGVMLDNLGEELEDLEDEIENIFRDIEGEVDFGDDDEDFPQDDSE